MLTKSALTLLLGYQARISRTEVVTGVASLETERQFPFSLLNDLRAYINYAPYYFQCFAALLLSPEFDIQDPRELLRLLGFPTRLQRYALSLFILGAYLNHGFDKPYKLLALNRLANLISLREEEFQKRKELVAIGALDQQRLNTKTRLSAKRHYAMLCVSLREYVDFLFLGEQSIGCEISPAMLLHGKAVVIRHFFNLGYGSYFNGANKAQLVEVYDCSNAPSFYAFRGRLENIKSYEAISFCFHEIDGRREEAQSNVESVVERIGIAMGLLRERYMGQSEAELEVEKMAICSLEMSRLYTHLTGKTYEIPSEIRNAILTARVSNEKMMEYAVDTYSELFFRLLGEALEFLITE